jgi:hypothetical protein
MKHWNKLSSIEEQIIRLDSVESILRVLGNSDAEKSDMLNVLWYLDGAVEDINKNLSEKFYELWDEVRNESWDKIDASVSTDSEASIRFEQILKPFITQE